MEEYDCIVVGLGGHGSSTLAQLAKRNLKVLGIERFNGTHQNGSSHGRSRIIRQAYFEDPKYVPLLARSFELWRELQNEIELLEHPKEKLLNMTGGLMIGYPESTVISGTLKSVKVHKLPHEILSASDIRSRYPVFQVDDREIGIYEKEAGYLIPELCIEAYYKIAKLNNATLHFEEIVINYEIISDDLVKVITNKSSYVTKKLVLTVGAWAPELYGKKIENILKLDCSRRVLFWFEPNGKNDVFQNIPIYIWDLINEGNFYGFPTQAGNPGGNKVAYHFMNKDISDKCTPQTVNKEVSQMEIESMRKLLDKRMPQLNGKLVATSTCMYTNTPDQHFLIDFLPNSNGNIILASPCSGHGFKFCSVVGEILSDMVQNSFTSHDISFFRLQRQNETRVLIEGGGDMPAQAGELFYEWATTKIKDKEYRNIVVIPWASEQTSDECMNNFKLWGSHLFNEETSTLICAPAQLHMISDIKYVKVFIKQLLNATAVFFHGGDQVKIVEVLNKWPGLRELIQSRYQSGLPFAGTSAGAAIMSVTMITGEGDFEVIEPGKVETKFGLGFVSNAIIDQHFVKRKRTNRLLSVLMYSNRNEPYGVGIDEDMAISLINGRKAKVLGGPNGKVLFFERQKKGEFKLKVLGTGEEFELIRDIDDSTQTEIANQKIEDNSIFNTTNFFIGTATIASLYLIYKMTTKK